MTTPFDHQTALTGYEDAPDEDPLSNGGRWTRVPSVVPGLRRTSAVIKPIFETTFVWDGEYVWNPEFWTDASMCWLINNLTHGGPVALKLRASVDGISTYYKGEFHANGGNVWKVYKRVDGGTETTLDTESSGPTLQTFDRFGFSVVGSHIGVWHQARLDLTHPSPIDANWTEIASADDSSIAGPGYMTLRLGGASTEVYQGVGGALFPTGGDGVPVYAPGAPVFDVNVRVVEVES